jgi:hypothetical protein
MLDILATMDIHDIPAWVALVISLIALGFQMRNYFVPLRMEVTDLHVAQVVGDTILLLFRLSLTNNSSRGKVVYNMLPISMTNTVTVDKVLGEFELSSQTASYKLTKSDVGLKIPISELLLPPLDILPHQSLSKWVGLKLTLPQLQPPLAHDLLVRLWLQGVDFEGEKMVGCPVEFYPMRAKPSETYDFRRSHFTPKFRILDILNNQYFIWGVLLLILLVLIAIWFHNQNSYVAPIFPTTTP